MRDNSFLAKQSKVTIVFTALVLTAIIGELDFLTGRDLILSILYLAPIALVIWYVGLRAGIVFSVLSAVTVYLSNYVLLPRRTDLGGKRSR